MLKQDVILWLKSLVIKDGLKESRVDENQLDNPDQQIHPASR